MIQSQVPLISKMPHIGVSIFTEMTQLANEHNAINLSQGFPDYDCDSDLIELVSQYMKMGYNQYAPMQGVMALREMISEQVAAHFKAQYDPVHEINISAGATQAIYTAVSALVKPGDEVIVFEPAYDSYVPSILMSQGTPVYSALKFPGYQVDWEDVAQKITPRTRALILNFPHNPAGSVMNESDLEQLVKLTEKTQIVLISDEVYSPMVFDQLPQLSLAKYPALAQRAFVIGSFGKILHATGWKLGFVMAPRDLMREFRRVHQFIVFTCNTPIQYAIAEYFTSRGLYSGLAPFFQKKRDCFIQLLARSRFKFTPSQGTYFQLLSYQDISEAPEIDFAKRLITEFGIAAIPLSVFYHQPVEHQMLRFCFAKKTETLQRAAEKLCQI